MGNNEFKYFVKIQNSYKENGNIYLEGVASGLTNDLNNRRMTMQVLNRFVDKIKSEGLPLTDGHLPSDSIIAVIGEIVDASIIDTDEMQIRCMLDAQHPTAGIIERKVKEGKKLAFSIEGYAKDEDTEIFFDEESDRYITRILDIEPVAITVTTEPAYTPSFAEVVYASVGIKNNLDITNSKMAEKEKREDVKKTKNDTIKSTDEEVTTDQEVTEEVSETSTEETDTTAQEEGVSTESTESDHTKQIEALTEKVSELEAKLAESKSEEEGEDVKTSKEKETNILSSVEDKLDKIMDVLKTQHDEIEDIKDLPFAKKSRVLSAKQKDGVGESDAPQTFEEKYRALTETD